jgi:hypothetical protein
MASCVQQARSTRKCHTRRAFLFPIAKCLPLPNMLHFLLLQLLTSFLCDLHRCLLHAMRCPSGGDENGRGRAEACAEQAHCSPSRSAPPRTAATAATANTASAAAVSPPLISAAAATDSAAAADPAVAATTDSADSDEAVQLPSRPQGPPSAEVGAAATAASAPPQPPRAPWDAL